MQRRLGKLLEGLADLDPWVAGLEVGGIAFDSRKVGKGDLFFGIPGTNMDGGAFAGQAVERGASAVVAGESLDLPVPCIVTKDPRRALSICASRFFGDPSAKLDVVGVTGTNGKTTVCALIAQLMEESGRKWARIGTTGYFIGDRFVEARTTTPDPVKIQEMLRTMVEEGFSGCSMEVSSHALDQKRTDGVRFKVGVFTNLSRDHLDYHGTMENYAEAKARLFRAMVPGGHGVLNAGSDYAEVMMNALPRNSNVFLYSLERKRDARLWCKAMEFGLDGTGFEVCLDRDSRKGFIPLLGRHNLENALAALGSAVWLGVPFGKAGESLSRARRPRGRLEEVEAPEGAPRVFIDYAHTPDALSSVLKALRPLCRKRIITVFGCGGDRDKGKRPLMGKAAEEYSDLVIITSDNPRTENPMDIIEEVARGIRRKDGLVLVPGRKEAIRTAIERAREGDIVLVAGKGHERYQVIGTEKIPFDDARVARELLWKE